MLPVIYKHILDIPVWTENNTPAYKEDALSQK